MKLSASSSAAIGLCLVVSWTLSDGAVARPAGAADTPDRGAEAVKERILGSELDPEGAVALGEVVLDLGPGELRVQNGHTFPGPAIAGAPREAVFLGEATFHIAPPDEIEAYQMKLFTGDSPLDAAVVAAVLVIGDPELSSWLFERPAGEAPAEERRAQAQTMYAEWVASPERRGFGADAAIFKAAFDDVAARGTFAALLDSDERGRFYYLFDPTALEQVTLGQFVPLELDDVERHRLERAIRRAQKRGRSTQTRLEDIGDWDTWMRTSIRDDDGSSRPGNVGFEPTHYVIDATIDNDELTIDGRATLTLEAQAPGRRAVDLELFADLEPTAVRDAAGDELAWFRSGSGLHVLLGGSPEPGSQLDLTVEYEGVVLDRIEKGIFAMRDTYTWYPHAGVFDRATYDVTLRRPKGLQLLASGRLVERSVEGRIAIERRTLEIPAFAFSFEIGDFEIVEKKVGRVALTVGFSKSTLAEDTGAKREVLETLENALADFERRFGPYPLDYLTVATVPRGYSQGFVSFLTLSHYLLGLPGDLWVFKSYADRRPDQRRETVAHELAHQWWGNKVGWYNYRDQWLSEALASYAALTYAASRAESEAIYMVTNSGDWRRSLSRIAQNGAPVESIGPVVMGERLVSSKSTSAYRAIVYDKGSVVFSMLARALGAEPLDKMLAALADAVQNRAVDTEVFIAALEQMSGLDLGSFADQYVYGTGVPDIYYTYEFRKADDGSWVVEGVAEPLSPATYRFRPRRTDSGAWDVERRHGESLDVEQLSLVVPFQVSLEEVDARKARRVTWGRNLSTGRGLGGNLALQGSSTSFSIPVPEEPQGFWLDQRKQVLAYFYSASRAPKRTLLYRARELSGDEAEALLLQALEAELMSPEAQAEAGWTDRDVANGTRREDARIHLELTEVYVDRGDDVRAAESYAAAEGLLKGLDANRYRRWRDRLAARMALRQGDYQAAWKTLEGKVRMRFGRGIGAADNARRRKWLEGYTGTGEEYAIVAIAALETGRDEVAREAMEAAEQRGADVGAIREALAASAGTD